jgi:glycosyltransferase involved in cell wall biosynthesis
MARSCKLKINCILACYTPGFKGGGPIKSISALTEVLGEEFDFRIFTLDRDLGDKMPYPNIPSLTWTPVGKATAIYIPPRGFRFYSLLRVLRRHPADILYLNSFFNFRTSILPLLFRKARFVNYRTVILAPRGEFSPNALLQRRVKKKAFLWLSRLIGLHKGLVWQASSIRESEHIHHTMGISPTAIIEAPNISDEVSDESATKPRPTPRKPGPLRIIFLSRISPFKNLDFLLNVVASCPKAVELAIFGPVECEKYWNDCKRQIDTLPLHIRVTYNGAVQSKNVIGTFGEFDVFVFPTKGENFGHVIHESLSAGTCVVTSDQTPWYATPDGGVTVLPLDKPDLWIAELERWGSRTEEQLEQFRHAAIVAVNTHRKERQSVARNRDLFLKSIGNQ